jgi:hypothetical protein
MSAAAANCQYERAAALRDVWQDLVWLSEQLERLKEIRRDYCFVYPATCGETVRWHLIQQGRVVAITDAPHSAAAARRCLKLWDRVYSTPNNELETPAYLDHAFVVASWFRKRPNERNLAIAPGDARNLARERLSGSAQID